MKIVSVVYHVDPDGVWAESSAVPGWSATAGNLDELRDRVEEGVRFALERDDVLVMHRLSNAGHYAPVVFDFVSGEVLEGDAGAGRAPDLQPQTV